MTPKAFRNYLTWAKFCSSRYDINRERGPRISSQRLWINLRETSVNPKRLLEIHTGRSSGMIDRYWRSLDDGALKVRKKSSQLLQLLRCTHMKDLPVAIVAGRDGSQMIYHERYAVEKGDDCELSSVSLELSLKLKAVSTDLLPITWLDWFDIRRDVIISLQRESENSL